MPWRASSVMEERLRFVARLLDGQAMTVVCREFGVSRKTGYKIFDRYKQQGLEALSDRSRRGGGDRFDDWVVVTSLSPTTSTTQPLANPAFPA
jgi:transposase